MNAKTIQGQIDDLDQKINALQMKKGDLQRLFQMYAPIEESLNNDAFLPVGMIAGKIGKKGTDSTPESNAFFDRVYAALKDLGAPENAPGDWTSKEKRVVWDVMSFMPYNTCHYNGHSGEISKRHMMHYADRGTHVPVIMATEEQVARAKLALCQAFDETHALYVATRQAALQPQQPHQTSEVTPTGP